MTPFLRIDSRGLIPRVEIVDGSYYARTTNEILLRFLKDSKPGDVLQVYQHEQLIRLGTYEQMVWSQSG